ALMAAQLNVGKVLLGAFLVPWWNKRAFARSLAIPLVALIALSLALHYFGARLPQLPTWLLYIAWGVVCALFAVTCHRLVLLDPGIVASRFLPPGSWRETRFFFGI